MDFYTLTIDFGSPACDELLRLRDQILRKPLGLEFTAEDIAEEYKDIHLVCYDLAMNMKGGLLLSPKDKGQIKMRQVAVSEDIQRQGIGALLVEKSEEIALEQGFKKMVLSARDTAVPFYKKLGYKKVGAAFEEVGIKHFKMEKTLK